MGPKRNTKVSLDVTFAVALNNMADRTMSADDIDLIQSRCTDDFKQTEHNRIVTLCIQFFTCFSIIFNKIIA
jgi:hypothetical protein